MLVLNANVLDVVNDLIGEIRKDVEKELNVLDCVFEHYDIPDRDDYNDEDWKEVVNDFINLAIPEIKKDVISCVLNNIENNSKLYNGGICLAKSDDETGDIIVLEKDRIPNRDFFVENNKLANLVEDCYNLIYKLHQKELSVLNVAIEGKIYNKITDECSVKVDKVDFGNNECEVTYKFIDDKEVLDKGWITSMLNKIVNGYSHEEKYNYLFDNLNFVEDDINDKT